MQNAEPSRRVLVSLGLLRRRGPLVAAHRIRLIYPAAGESVWFIPLQAAAPRGRGSCRARLPSRTRTPQQPHTDTAPQAPHRGLRRGFPSPASRSAPGGAVWGAVAGAVGAAGGAGHRHGALPGAAAPGGVLRGGPALPRRLRHLLPLVPAPRLFV